MKRAKAAVHAAFIAVLLIAISGIGGHPALAAQIKTSAVCKTGIDNCIQFTSAGVIPTVASYTFTAPTAGTALVSFNGSMQCVNANGTDDSSHGVIDLSTQITTLATPGYQAPGGSRFAMRLPPARVIGPVVLSDRSVPINLASNRVVPLTAGAHTFSFKIARNRMDPGTKCKVWNGDFNVVFVP